MHICKIPYFGFLLLLTGTLLSASEEVRILFFGDSLTAGYQLSQEEAFPAQLEILARQQNWPVRAINAGVSGDTSSAGLSRLQWNLQRPFEVFVLALGANDGLRGIPLATTQANLESILQRVRERNPSALLVVAGMQLPPNYGEEYAKEFREMFPNLAEAEKVLLIPFLLEGVATVPELNLPDAMHPNAEGQKRVAAHVWKILKPAMAEKWPGLTPAPK